MIIRFQSLLLKKNLNDAEKIEFQELREKIKELPDVFETMENLRIHLEMRELLSTTIHDSDKK